MQDFITSGKLEEHILNYVSDNVEKLINNLIKNRGMALYDNTLNEIYNITEQYAKQLSDIIISESLSDNKQSNY